MHKTQIKHKAQSTKRLCFSGFGFCVLFVLWFLCFACLAGRQVFSSRVYAQEIFSISPAIIDLKAKSRERIEREIIIKNNVQRKISIYARVGDVETGDGKETFLEPSDSDKRASLANWTRVSAGAVELLPGEEKKIPLIVEVNPFAKNGMYHARVMFAEGATRDSASAGKDNGIMLNMEVWKEKEERVSLRYFRPEKNIFWKSPVTFLYALENSGSEEIRPKGEIMVYDKKGKEIGALDLNLPAIPPGKIYEGSRAWEKAWLFGTNKAILSLSYGSGSPKTLEDTIFFQMIPWQTLVASLLGAGVFVYIRKRKK